MSRSRGDQRGKRVAGEILGRDCMKVVGDRIVAVCGGEPVGSPVRKRDAKERVKTQRRVGDKTLVRQELGGLDG